MNRLSVYLHYNQGLIVCREGIHTIVQLSGFGGVGEESAF